LKIIFFDLQFMVARIIYIRSSLFATSLVPILYTKQSRAKLAFLNKKRHIKCKIISQNLKIRFSKEFTAFE